MLVWCSPLVCLCWTFLCASSPSSITDQELQPLRMQLSELEARIVEQVCWLTQAHERGEGGMAHFVKVHYEPRPHLLVLSPFLAQSPV